MTKVFNTFYLTLLTGVIALGACSTDKTIKPAEPNSSKSASAPGVTKIEGATINLPGDITPTAEDRSSPPDSDGEPTAPPDDSPEPSDKLSSSPTPKTSDTPSYSPTPKPSAPTSSSPTPKPSVAPKPTPTPEPEIVQIFISVMVVSSVSVTLEPTLVTLWMCDWYSPSDLQILAIYNDGSESLVYSKARPLGEIDHQHSCDGTIAEGKTFTQTGDFSKFLFAGEAKWKAYRSGDFARSSLHWTGEPIGVTNRQSGRLNYTPGKKLHFDMYDTDASPGVAYYQVSICKSGFETKCR